MTAREEGNRIFFLEPPPKPALFLEFPSNGVADINSNHMLLVHYISQFDAEKIVLLQHHIVPFGAGARENNLTKGIARKEFSACVPERNTVRGFHCSSHLVY